MRALISFGIGPHAELLEIAKPSFEAFAERHGYEIVIPQGVSGDRPISWLKIPILIESLKSYEEILWVDADMVIVDPSEDVPVPPGYWQGLARHHTTEGEIPNCGLWFLRQPMLPVLEMIWGMTDYISHGWWEQSAMLTLLGYDPFERPVYLHEPTELYEKTYFLNSGWNLHLRDRVHFDRHRVRHATMYENKATLMRQWAAEAQRTMAI